jgi:hypothetical protein
MPRWCPGQSHPELVLVGFQISTRRSGTAHGRLLAQQPDSA